MKTTFRLETKILALLAIVAAGYAVSIGFNVVQGRAQERQLRELANLATPAALDTQAAVFAFEAAVKGHEDAILTGDSNSMAPVLEQAQRAGELLRGVIGRARAGGRDDPTLVTAQERLDAFSQRAAPLFNLVAAKGLNHADAQAELKDFRARTAAAREAMTAASHATAQALQDTLRAIEDSTHRQRQVGLILFVAVLVTAAVIARWIVRRTIVRPVLQLSGEVGSGAESVSAAAEQFTAASQALAKGASQSAAALETSAAALEQMSGVTRANAQHAQSAKQLAKHARDAADAGVTRMAELSSAMSAIQTSSKEVSAIIKTIDEIAFQTNILALNAAIEAARAGEAGLGFAVVADEVRNLAQRSADAARQTAERVEQARLRSDQGGAMNAAVGEHLTAITARVREVDELIAQIASASHEQEQGIAQVTRSIADLDQLTQKNAALAEETSASAGELNAQTTRLRSTAISFEQLASGIHASAGTPRTEDASGPETAPIDSASSHVPPEPRPVALADAA